MLINEDKQVMVLLPLMNDNTVIYIGNGSGPVHDFVTGHYEELRARFLEAGFKFLFLPKLVEDLDPELVEYLFPGNETPLSVERLTGRIRELSGIGEKSGAAILANETPSVVR